MTLHYPDASAIEEAGITCHSTIDDATMDKLWEMFVEMFTPLETMAMIQHLFDEETFREVMGHPDMLKAIPWLDGEPTGVATVTNNLELIPQMSPKFLRARYPEHAARNAIFFGFIIFVSPRRATPRTFEGLMHVVARTVADAGGVVVMDVCQANAPMVRHTEQVMMEYTGRPLDRIDAQLFYATEFPMPEDR